MRKLSNEEIGKLGMYELQGYIGAMNSPTFGGWRGTNTLIEKLNMGEKKKLKLLEVGCSTGYITRYIAQQYDCEIIGIDLSEVLLEIAREEALELNLTNVSFQKGNAENLPFSDDSFDIVYGEAITALVPDPLKVINEYRRVLKPGGKLATLDLYMNESLNKNLVIELNEIMTNVIGTEVKIRTLKDWKNIYMETGFDSIQIEDHHEDLFKREYSFGTMVKITFKLIYYLIFNKKVRKKVMPTLKFARKFQDALKRDCFGYFIFMGIK